MSSPKILAVETTTEACSAALLYQESIQECYQLAPRQHTHLILPMLESLLADAALTPRDLDAIAFCCGPGSFTGCRIGASLVQAVAFAADIPVVRVSSLQCLAQGAYRDFLAKRVLAAIDARMNEVYWGSYQLGEEGIMLEFDAEQLSDPMQLALTQLSHFIGVGSAWDKYHEIVAPRFKGNQLQQCYSQRYPRAYDVAVLAKYAYQRGQLVSAEEALPVYLREKIT
ncbi:MAG: tRNA (adenosine(37)-N6)-threonylcarbamoyltransferase complex dimerization subunit type 1 TsaB [Pseudomonadota bacterium]